MERLPNDAHVPGISHRADSKASHPVPEHLPRAHFRLSGLSLYVFHFCHIFLQFVLMHMLHNAVEETIHFLLIIFLVIGMFISIVKAIRTVVPQRVA